MLHLGTADELVSVGRTTRLSETDPRHELLRGAVALSRSCILRCGCDDERSGANDDADGCRGGAGSCDTGGCRILVGLLVSGSAEHGDIRAEAGDSDVAGSAAGARQNLRRESVCDAGFVSAPGDSAFVWAARWQSRGVLLPRMAVRCVQRTVRRDSFAFQPGQTKSGTDFCGALSV
jgi:hypothetical protein